MTCAGDRFAHGPWFIKVTCNFKGAEGGAPNSIEIFPLMGHTHYWPVNIDLVTIIGLCSHAQPTTLFQNRSNFHVYFTPSKQFIRLIL